MDSKNTYTINHLKNRIGELDVDNTLSETKINKYIKNVKQVLELESEHLKECILHNIIIDVKLIDIDSGKVMNRAMEKRSQDFQKLIKVDPQILHDEFTNKNMVDPSTFVDCPNKHCKGRLLYSEVQLRSNDEPVTRFERCNTCNFSRKF